MDALNMFEKIQGLSDMEKAHFKMALMNLMSCYTDDTCSGLLVVNRFDEESTSIVSLGVHQDDVLEVVQTLAKILEADEKLGKTGAVTVQ